ncbi:riboflavin synthase [Lujinxingia litoralis]|uniref:Riboflavin synthase n=1 Tax=Lujinxingia litoralis TaxID=2211119 RepID=A0A328CAA8_9DELT|nr:riboflavin synthase [Lujinxingia litoralis]RAL24694.1 riboflavin synthase [Lujinxingia litoralis]
MFTGLVADLGEVRARKQAGENWELTLATSFDLSTVELGESIAVDGACLTVTRLESGAFCVDASPETLQKTTLGDRRPGDRVHLERALRVGDRLGGHLVLGHVDGVGVVRSRRKDKNAWLFEVDAPPEVAPYLIDKGSVCVDGVSLTLNSVAGARFSLAIIPFTSDKTKLTDYQVGQRVNLEADVLGKYVRKFVDPQATGGLDLAKLARFGFQ